MIEQPVDPERYHGPEYEIDEEDSIRATFARLYADGRAYTQAEIDRQKLRAGIVGAGVRDAAIFAAIAIMLVFAALVALLVGAILALSPAWGPLGATGIVVGTALLVTVALLLMAKARISRMKKAARA